MSSTNEPILICCFDFPPNQGIGGRRWAKFARQLAEEGHRIHVIKADPVLGNKESAWVADVQHSKIKVHSLPRKYPEAISHPKPGLVGSIQFRMATARLKKRHDGTIFDLAVNFRPQFEKKANELIHTHRIKNVMVTGAPFNLVYYCASLKEQHPHLNIIVDYRDPWITAQNYGMPQLTDERMQAELSKQATVFQLADWVCCPNEYLLKEIQQTAQAAPKCTFRSLPHFFDPDEIDSYRHMVKDDEKIRFVYGGALYMGLEPYLEKLLSALDKIKQSHPDLYEKMEFEIYTRDVDKKPMFARHSDVVHIEAPIGNRLFERLAKATYAVIFLSHHNKDFKTTKYFEFLPFGKPLVYIGPEGAVAQGIQRENLGIALKDFENELPSLLMKGIEVDRKKLLAAGEQHSLQNITASLRSMFS